MATLVKEHAFAVYEHSFTVSVMNNLPTSVYVEYANTSDFHDPRGGPSYGASPSATAANRYHINHIVFVDPNIAGPGDIVYWRLREYNGEIYDTHQVRLRRPRSEQQAWNFIVGASGRTVGGVSVSLSTNCKQFCIPTALGQNPDFFCFCGDMFNGQISGSLLTSLDNYTTVREELRIAGIKQPIYFSPGDGELEAQTNNRLARLRLFPSAGIGISGSLTTRGPYKDPQQEDANNAGSYYYYAYGNALFIFINDYLSGTFISNINSATCTTMKAFVESILKEHRHKYKWCFTFTHTSVDKEDPDNTGGSVNTIAEATTTKAWLMNLHQQYQVTAHFSGHYYGWRVNKNSNGTTYVNTTFGGSSGSNTNSEWHNDIAFANVRIGVDETGNLDIDSCKIDIINSGVSGVAGQVLNTSSNENGVCSAYNGSVITHRNTYESIFNSSVKQELVHLSDTWLYNATSTRAAPVDLVLTTKFYKTDFIPIIYDTTLSGTNLKKSWKNGNAPFYSGQIRSTIDLSNSGFLNSNLVTSLGKSYVELPLPWQTGTNINLDPVSTPMYFLKKFDIDENLNINELQMTYTFQDAAYVWINGILAWYSDGEGIPDSASPITVTYRPELNPERVNASSGEYAQDIIVDFETLSNSQDREIYLLVQQDSKTRKPKMHYEINGQPIRITNVDIIRSLKRTNNIIAVMVVQGRDSSANNVQESSDAAFDLELIGLGDKKSFIYSPQITSPEGSDQFNRGTVDIEWNINNPPTSTSDELDPYEASITSAFSNITYEIEYTDKYIGSATNWFTVKRRIQYTDTSYSWTVGKMIKSSTIRIRMRAYDSLTESYSDWSVSGEFSINIFNLLAPAIISPKENFTYSDFILIILDDTLTKNTFNQKVRYTFEYASKKQNIDWTTIRYNIPFGQNIIRWNIDGLNTSDDYVLRLTAKNVSTCLQATEENPDQIEKSYIYNIHIQQSGLFIIDTMPPQAVLEIDSEKLVTNELNQIINFYAEDKTTDVKQIQIRECDATSDLSLGDLEDPYEPEKTCPPIETLIKPESDLHNLIGKPIQNSSKIKWTFNDKSGLKKLEALLSDYGGNTSLQENIRVFLKAFNAKNETINDFIIVLEQRDKIILDDIVIPPSIKIEPSIFEVVYFGTSLGNFYVLEPFSRLLYTLNNNDSIYKIIEFNDIIYIFSYNQTTDVGKVYRHDSSVQTLINTFSSSLSKTNGCCIYNDKLYIGLENGQLWVYNNLTFTLLTIFTEPINILYADQDLLYIGFQNSIHITMYNGSSFTTVDL